MINNRKKGSAEKEMSIDRVAVKNRAKNLVRTARPSMLTAALLLVLLGAVINWLSSRLVGLTANQVSTMLENYQAGNMAAAYSVVERSSPSSMELLLDQLLQLAFQIIGVGFTIFVVNTVRQTGPVYGNLLDGFTMMPRLLFLLILRYIFIVLWSLLIIVPGIIAAYKYRFAVYLMIDHPEWSALDCLRESKRMTQGYKGQLFVLDLSFLLWLILCALPVIGYAAQIYVTPYKEAAHVYYYEIVKADELGREGFSYNV